MENIIERIIFIIIIAILLYVIVVYNIKIFQKKRALKKRFKRGILLENEAYSYLKKQGYKIIDIQQINYHHFEIDGIKKSSKLILDYYVEKNGKKYIVEVKSGHSAIYITDKNTRRQLLEYAYSIESDGVFLLDMENENMQLVKFHSYESTIIDDFRNLVIIIALLGIFLPFIKIKILLTLLLVAIWKFPEKSKSILNLIIP